jgi:hypothetical protein
MVKRNKLLLVLAFGLVLLGACGRRGKQESVVVDETFKTQIYNGDYDPYKMEMIVVNKIPRGAYAGEEMPEEFSHFAWYEIGFSRNGKEPIEYIWSTGSDPNSYYVIRYARIGDKGAIYLADWSKENGKKLPQPNSKDPPIVFDDIYWRKAER